MCDEEEVRETAIVSDEVGRDDEGAILSAIISDEVGREATRVHNDGVRDDEGAVGTHGIGMISVVVLEKVSVVVPGTASISEDKVREATVSDEEEAVADEAISSATAGRVSLSRPLGTASGKDTRAIATETEERYPRRSRRRCARLAHLCGVSGHHPEFGHQTESPLTGVRHGGENYPGAVATLVYVARPSQATAPEGGGGTSSSSDDVPTNCGGGTPSCGRTIGGGADGTIVTRTGRSHRRIYRGVVDPVASLLRSVVVVVLVATIYPVLDDVLVVAEAAAAASYIRAFGVRRSRSLL